MPFAERHGEIMSYDLEKYLNDKLETLVKGALKVTLKNPKQSAFFMRFTSQADVYYTNKKRLFGN